jgi:hypothetical protein
MSAINNRPESLAFEKLFLLVLESLHAFLQALILLLQPQQTPSGPSGPCLRR